LEIGMSKPTEDKRVTVAAAVFRIIDGDPEPERPLCTDTVRRAAARDGVLEKQDGLQTVPLSWIAKVRKNYRALGYLTPRTPRTVRRQPLEQSP
jgi:hypothetical protein